MSIVKLIKPKRFEDDRGWFTEVYNQSTFTQMGVNVQFVQDNHSFSKPVGTVRGLHFQRPPRGQDKLVRCIAGRILDVAVDLRKGSPTYGHYVAAELSAQNGHQLFIPIGFGHGFATLEPNCEITYKCSDTYAPECDGGIKWDDESIAIEWQLPIGIEPTLSNKDTLLPLLKDFDSPFVYDGVPLHPL